PRGGVGADGGDGAADVAELEGVVIALGAQAIAEDEGGDAVLREPLADDAGLMRGESAVPAAGADDDGGAGGGAVGGREDLDGGDVLGLVAVLAGGLAFPEVEGGLVLELDVGGGGGNSGSPMTSAPTAATTSARAGSVVPSAAE